MVDNHNIHSLKLGFPRLPCEIETIRDASSFRGGQKIYGIRTLIRVTSSRYRFFRDLQYCRLLLLQCDTRLISRNFLCTPRTRIFAVWFARFCKNLFAQPWIYSKLSCKRLFRISEMWQMGEYMHFVTDNFFHIAWTYRCREWSLIISMSDAQAILWRVRTCGLLKKSAVMCLTFKYWRNRCSAQSCANSWRTQNTCSSAVLSKIQKKSISDGENGTLLIL